MYYIYVGIDGWLVLADGSQQVCDHLLGTSITEVGWIASVDHVGDRAVVTHHIGVWDDDDLGVLSGIVHHYTSEVCNTGGGVGDSHGSNREEDICLAVLI